MESGRILVAEHDGTYIIKLCGDVRVTLCTSLGDYIDKIFSYGDVRDVVIDMEEARGADSTTLGLLVKLAIHCNRKLHLRPKIFCNNPDLHRILESMSFNDIFDIYQSRSGNGQKMEELIPIASDTNDIRQQVLEAHRLLVQLNPNKEAEFFDLIKALERE